MTLSQKLQTWIQNGIRQIGELSIQSNDSNDCFVLSHQQDIHKTREPGYGGLEIHEGPDDARDLSTHADDGSYRFVKAQTNMRSGWVMILKSAGDLRMALDHFYPASVGLHAAAEEGRLEIENLRDKLKRQTGMYRFARTISDAGAQRLVREVCGPAHQCARRILWQIDDQTPLDESEASRYPGIPDGANPEASIPLLCREACNHFVAECRRVAKEEKTG
jgi:4Fe-4S iron-sulfur cluster binding domain/DR2241 stabilising domain